MDDFAAPYLSLSPALRGAWERERPGRGEADAHAFFALLAREVQSRLRVGERAELPAIFAAVERSLAGDVSAAARFLERLVDGAPETYVHVLPWLGARSLALLRAWEAGARDPFLAPGDAHARLLGPLAEACPGFARAWPRAAPHVCAADGTTTLHGVADVCFEVARAAIGAGDEAGARAIAAAVEGPLGAADRALARAFERCFLERTRELSLAQLDRLRPHFGPRARCYWDAHLRLGEPRFGVWEGGLRPTAITRRGESWGWSLELPRGDLGEVVRESLQRDGVEVGADETPVEDSAVSASWSWSESDPAGEYVLEVWLGARALGRFDFALE